MYAERAGWILMESMYFFRVFCSSIPIEPHPMGTFLIFNIFGFMGHPSSSHIWVKEELKSDRPWSVIMNLHWGIMPKNVRKASPTWRPSKVRNGNAAMYPESRSVQTRTKLWPALLLGRNKQSKTHVSPGQMLSPKVLWLPLTSNFFLFLFSSQWRQPCITFLDILSIPFV